MLLSLSTGTLSSLTSAQLNNFFPDGKPVDLGEYKRAFDLTLDRLQFCFKHCVIPSYNENGTVKFNHLHSDQYLVYLWFLSNSVWKESGDNSLASKIYYLNKTLHGFDCMYNTGLPDIFLIFHGVGTVLGKATYSDFLSVAHGVTIGHNRGIYPTLGKGVALTAKSTVIGSCNIGDKVTVSVNTLIFDRDVPAGSVVYGQGADLSIRPSKTPYIYNIYNSDLL